MMEQTRREKINVIVRVINIFLVALLFFSVGFGGVSLMSVLPALSITYIIVFYWEKRVAQKQKRE